MEARYQGSDAWYEAVVRAVSATGEERYVVEYIEDEETEEGLSPDFLRGLDGDEGSAKAAGHSTVRFAAEESPPEEVRRDQVMKLYLDNQTLIVATLSPPPPAPPPPCPREHHTRSHPPTALFEPLGRSVGRSAQRNIL